MMKSLQTYLFILLAVWSMRSNAQQDPQFNQYFFNPLGINPAYAGSRGMLSAVALHRSQWLGFEGAPSSQVFAIHAPSKNKKMGYGIQLVNDQIGPKNTVSLSGIYAYKVKLGLGQLGFGLRASLYNHQFNWDEIEYKDKSAFANTERGKESYLVPSFDFGMYYHDKKNYIGFELTHLNEGKLGVDGDNEAFDFATKQNASLLLTAGRAIRLNRSLVLKPAILARVERDLPLVVDANVNLLIKEKLWLGLAYRYDYGAIAIFEYNINKALRFGYSYDMAFNDIYRRSGGSHEFFLGYDFKLFQSQIASPRYF